MHKFYIPSEKFISDYLSEDESRHAVKVLRMKQGDRFQIINGSGDLIDCEISEANTKKCGFRVLAKKHIPHKSYHIHLAIAPTKNLERMEWMVEKCTEIGIDEISFFISNHSERRILKLDRFERKAISALKQSHNYYLPRLNPLNPFEKLLDTFADDYMKFIGYIDTGAQKHLFNTAKPGMKYCILIGPEGDFSGDEIELAMSKGFNPVSLGSSVLRTETAGLYACTTLNLINEK